jgi:hypothetical protein
MSPRPLTRVLLVGALALTLGGCGGKAATVKGAVKMGGKPLADAHLSFEPAEGGPNLGGETVRSDAQGRFEILPDRRKHGLKPGKYFVRVSKWVDKKTGKVPDPEEFEQLKSANQLKNVLPPQYNDPESNPPITVEIKSGTNDLGTLEVRER